MEELIQKLQNDHGLSAEQSYGILDTIKNFVKDKFPMVGGAIDNIFPAGSAPSSTDATVTTTHTDATTVKSDGGFLDKISNFIPGGAGEKIEEFAKDKLGGMFGSK
jgi:hypothetical protein